MTVNINSRQKCNKTAKCGTMLNHNRTDKVGLLVCTYVCAILYSSQEFHTWLRCSYWRLYATDV